MDMGGDATDFSMTAFISFPQVLGHEVVADVVEVGPDGRRARRSAHRVVLQCWLSCAPRGISPVCPACEAGDYSLCWNFTDGPAGAGHPHRELERRHRRVRRAPARARTRWRSRSPTTWPTRVAVLADPFAVSLHSITRNPPPPGGRALVWGARCARHVARSPSCARCIPTSRSPRSCAIPRSRQLARKLGAHVIDSPTRATRRSWSRWPSGRAAGCAQPWAGLPIAHPGSDRRRATTRSVRRRRSSSRSGCWRQRGTIAVSGVHAAGRFEWSPWYFKEVRIVGSNAFGIEEVDGVRKHAIEHYLDFARDGRVDISRDADAHVPRSTSGATRSRPSPSSTTPARSRSPSTSAEHDRQLHD